MPSKLCVARTQYNTHPWPSLSNLTQPAREKKRKEKTEKLLAPNGNQSKLKQESISVLFGGCSRIEIESAGCNNRERWAAKLKTSDGFQKQSSQIWKNDGDFARDGPTLSPVHPQWLAQTNRCSIPHIYRSFCWTFEDIPSITVIQFGGQIKWFEKFGLVTLKRVHSVQTNTLLSECLWKKKWEHKKISTWVMLLANPPCDWEKRSRSQIKWVANVTTRLEPEYTSIVHSCT